MIFLDDLREDWNEQNQLFISDYSKVCFGGAFTKYGRVINFQFALDSVLRPPIFSVSLFCGLYNAGAACPPQLYLVGTDSFDKKTLKEQQKHHNITINGLDEVTSLKSSDFILKIIYPNYHVFMHAGKCSNDFIRAFDLKEEAVWSTTFTVNGNVLVRSQDNK